MEPTATYTAGSDQYVHSVDAVDTRYFLPPKPSSTASFSSPSSPTSTNSVCSVEAEFRGSTNSIHMLIDRTSATL